MIEAIRLTRAFAVFFILQGKWRYVIVCVGRFPSPVTYRRLSIIILITAKRVPISKVS
jgi:hypothetical protein